MTWKNCVPFVLALAFGLVAAKIGRDVFARSRHTTDVQTRLANVVIARADIVPGSVLSEQDLTMGQAPAESAPQSAFKTLQELVGRVPTVGLVRGMVIVESMLAPVGTGGGAQALVPPGMRLVTVEVNEFTGVAGLIVPGAHVDVVSTLADDEHKLRVAKTVVQNVKVIAVGQQLDQLDPQGKKGDKLEAVPSRSVTLLVKPRQAEILQFVGSSAPLRLALRGPTDSVTVASKTIGVADLLDHHAETPNWLATWLGSQRNTVAVSAPTTRPVDNTFVAVPPVPAVTPIPQPRTRTVEIINGSELTTVRYEHKDLAPGSVLTGTQDEHQPIGGSHE